MGEKYHNFYFGTKHDKDIIQNKEELYLKITSSRLIPKETRQT